MSLSIRQSVVEKFNFNGKNVRAVYIQDVGECLVASDVYKAVGYSRKLGYKQYSDLSRQKLEEHHHRTTELQQGVEDRDNRIQTIQHENVGLQGKIRNARRTITDLIENCHVARCGEYDNILVGVQKNKPIEDDAKKSRHAFYMMRCQKRRKGLLMARLKKEYPYMSEKGTCEDPNAVHRWCGFKEDVLGEDNYYRNHFSLDTTTKREFEELFSIYMD